MTEIKIFDCDKDNYLININALIECIYDVDNNFFNANWVILEAECGYGLRACEIDDIVSSKKKLKIEGVVFFNWLRETNEYFFNILIKNINTKEEIGLKDSTYLFLKSDRQGVLNEINNCFSKVIIEKK